MRSYRRLKLELNFDFLSEFSTYFLRIFCTYDIFLSIHFYVFVYQLYIFGGSYYFWQVRVLPTSRELFSSTKIISIFGESYYFGELRFLRKSSTTNAIYIQVVPDPTEVIDKFSTQSLVLILRTFKNLAGTHSKVYWVNSSIPVSNITTQIQNSRAFIEKNTKNNKI